MENNLLEISQIEHGIKALEKRILERCFNRIYFDADGTVDYYLFDFAETLPQTKQNEFKELLGQFIITYKFGLTAGKPFAQGSPANYRDPL